MFGFNKFKKNPRKTIADYKREMLIKQGREQFALLIKKGLGVPIALLTNKTQVQF